jgi:transcriptional regulator with XRE-family HTH domain
MFQTSQSSTGQAGHGGSDELKRAKMELVDTREQGDPAALQTVLARYPQHIAALTYQAAFDAVFGAPAAAPAFASLKALRNARQLSLKAVAERLGLGLDVLSALEAGRIRARSVPERLLAGLGAILDSTAEQVGAILGAQVAPAPAFRRATKDGFADAQLDFADAVKISPAMTSEQKSAWLDSESHS